MYILDYEALRLAKNRERELVRQASVYRLMSRNRASHQQGRRRYLEAIKKAFVAFARRLLGETHLWKSELSTEPR